jgi:hypothetical protein
MTSAASLSERRTEQVASAAWGWGIAGFPHVETPVCVGSTTLPPFTSILPAGDQRSIPLHDDALDLLSIQNRDASHQTVTSTCCVSTVRGMPRSARTCKQAWMAFRTLVRASSLVAPWLTHPGMLGQLTTQTPSSSRSIVTTKFMIGPNLSRTTALIASPPPTHGNVQHQPTPNKPRAPAGATGAPLNIGQKGTSQSCSAQNLREKIF